MNKVIFSLLILLLIPATYAQCTEDCDTEDIDFSDPDQVNDLETPQLATAIEQGLISDMSIVDENRLADALNEKPSISTKLEDADLARAVNQDLSLMDDPSIMADIDSRIVSDTHLVNDNPNIRKKWFANKGITDEGAEIDSYDGEIVKTRGSEATEFNIDDHPGATVTMEGELILANGAEIGNAVVTTTDDGDINVDGGHTDLTNTDDANINIIGGTVQIDDEILSSPDNTPIEADISDGTVTLTGTNIVMTEDDVVTAVFSGEVTTYEDSHKVFSGGTEYTTYVDGVKSKTYTVSQNTVYHTKVGCDGSTSCMEDYDGNLNLFAADNNEIDIKTYDNSVNDLKVNHISDESMIVFNLNDKVEVTFSEDPITVRGDLNALENLEYSFTNLQGEVHDQSFFEGEFIQCSDPCKVCGEVTQNMDDRLKELGLYLTPGTSIVAAYKTQNGFEVYRSNEGEIFIIDTELGGTIFYMENKNANLQKLGHKSAVDVVDATIGPQTRKMINDEIISQAYGKIPDSTIPITPRNTLDEIVLDKSDDPLPGYFKSKDTDNKDILVLKFGDSDSQNEGMGRLSLFAESSPSQLSEYDPDGTLLSLSEFQRYTNENGEVYFAHDLKNTDIAEFFNEAGDEISPLEQKIKDELIAKNHIIQEDGKFIPVDDKALLSFARRDNPQLDELNIFAMEHEADHGEYFTNPEYRNEVQDYWNNLDPIEQKYFVNQLKQRGEYDPDDTDLMARELSAYSITNGEGVALQCLDMMVCGLLEEEQKRILNRWRKDVTEIKNAVAQE